MRDGEEHGRAATARAGSGNLVVRIFGGPRRARVVLVLAAALGLDGAGKAAVAATTPDLTQSLGADQTEIGLLVSVASLATAVCMLPAGVLADRLRRTWLLAIGTACWGAAMLLAGMAPGYGWLLAAEVLVGASVATTIPVVASLTGDYFPAAERARMYGLILCGELAGTGAGFLVSGEIAALTVWRAAFWIMVVPAAVIAFAVARLPEPSRGGQPTLGEATSEPDRSRQVAETARPRRLPVSPHDTGSTWHVVLYVLRVPTNVLLVIASTLGYFYFAGARTFAVQFGMVQYGLSQAAVTPILIGIGAGALAGVIAGGRISDRLLERGRPAARVIVPVVSVTAAVVVLAPAVLSGSPVVGIPLLTVGAALIGAPNPALDAARLDIIPAPLWGRAEAVRAILRTLGEAAAPTLFGYASGHIFAGTAHALGYTYALFLIPLLAAPLVAFPALRTYPRDTATAAAYHDARPDTE